MEASETLPSDSRSFSADLTYRLATWDDEAELRKMRIACGWGEDSLSGRLSRCELGIEFLCIFFLGLVPVGMASIETVDSGGNDRDLCDFKTGRVMISALFIYSSFQGQSMGNRIMDLLELECSFLGFKTCTVHTMPFEEDGKTETKTVKWYRRRGYVPIKVYELRYGVVLSAFLEKAVPSRTEDGSTHPEGRCGRAWVFPSESVVEEVRRSFALEMDKH